MRGQARDYDQWALTGMMPALHNCLPDFMQHENYYKLDSFSRNETKGQEAKRLEKLAQHHGSGVGMAGGEATLRWDVLDVLPRPCSRRGIPATDDFNAGSNEGVGYFSQPAQWLALNTAKAFASGSVCAVPISSCGPIPRCWPGWC